MLTTTAAMSSSSSSSTPPPPPPLSPPIPHDSPSVVGSVSGRDQQTGATEFGPFPVLPQSTSNPDIIPPTTVHPLLQATPPHSRISAAVTAPIPIPKPNSSLGLASRASQASTHPAMIFSDIYRSPRSPIAKLRHQSIQLSAPLSPSTPGWVAEEHADLLSRDKNKQKDAVKRYLDAKIKNDWDFQWPPRSVNPAPKIVIPDGIVAAPCIQTSTPDDVPVQGVETTSLDTTEPTKPVQDKTQDDDGYQVDDDEDESDAESTYSTVSEDPVHYRPRTEWTSDFSDDEPLPSRSPFRFDTPGNVGPTVQAVIFAKQAKRRRAVRKEAEWNEGLACFEARRTAWTGARTVRVRTKPVLSPSASPRSPRRFFFRRSMSSSPPSSTVSSTQPPNVSDSSDASSLAKGDEKELQKQLSKDTSPSTPPSNQNYPVETLIPIAPPLLPPNNILRASITPSVYISLYDKVIIHSLQPSCPINLSDMLRACVTGWKRDGEWPPRPTAAPAPVARKKKKPTPQQENSGNVARRMSFGLLGRDKDEESAPGKIFRRSLHKALGIANYGAQDIPAAVKPKQG
ncbi:hypothetical protein AK830_g843 [Neonectria ditissima]|uniref:Gag1-like clamp domain-containing protein n=1 Tax=Neonectria ditissima TaxID=78410 RepID=A0A0N8H8W2_9HYPO|nr:hypothetical protein AK830_g843 [Neonectria ditissima]